MSETRKLLSRVKAVWRRQQRLHLTAGLLEFCRWILPLFVVAVIADWKLHLPAWARGVALLVVLGISLCKAFKAGWRHVRRFDATRTALRIEEQKGGMESLLVTAIQLGTTEAADGTSRELADLTCRKAEESAGEVRPRESVRYGALRKPVLVVLFVALLIGVISMFYGPILLAGIGRMFTPWLDVEYPTRTQLILATGDIVVQEGQPVSITAKVSGVVPRRAKLYLRTGKSKARVRKLSIVKGKCEYVIDTAFRGFTYRLAAGDARSDWHEVTVIATPHIERADVLLEYPAYTKRPSETVEALTVTVPETTRITWQLKLDRAVSEAGMALSGEKPVPMEISDDGFTVTAQRTATESRSYSFSWIERDHGFAFKSPNSFLQVAPDRPPRAELTQPTRNVYATLGRKLALAFRGADDHGVAESFVTYRVDKTEEERVPFDPTKPIDGTEQVIDWDYRSVLTNLTVGQTVTFAVELTDAYPGENGPHVARTEARRMQLMTMADYLAQVEKQRKRLLARLRTVYREERDVHEVVMRLDRTDPIFIQTCQLEAVRQDLMREGLNRLAGQIQALTDDLAANGVTNEASTATLDELRTDILDIGANNLTAAATALRGLASESGRKANAAHAEAVHKVDSVARELGLLVLELGFRDAADVMAREMHAAAQTQAGLRVRTITPGGDATALAAEQERLGQWLKRLLEASPRERESTVEDALIEFTLTRIVKQMLRDGVDEQLARAAGLIRDGKGKEASKIQVSMIASMLKGSFRLRVGAERETLADAMEIFTVQAAAQQKLRTELEALDEKTFKKRRSDLRQGQTAINKAMQMVLMPEVPRGRWKLLEVEASKVPPVAELLAQADTGTAEAATRIGKGERDAAAKAQARAEAALVSLAEVARKRIAAMTQAVRTERLNFAAMEIDETIVRFGERQLSLLEKTEDAAADKAESDYLGDQEEALADALEELKLELEGQIARAMAPSEYSLSLPGRLDVALQLMREAVPLLKDNKPGQATALQVSAIEALEVAQELLAEHGQNLAKYAGLLAMTRQAVAPSPYVNEIVEEQQDMMGQTTKAKPDQMPGLALPQKNLIHAVDAILVALDPVAHLVESGTVMMFAKDDMDAAAEALTIKDSVEALDAQDYIIETLTKLRDMVGAVVPQYHYLLEITEALHETFQEGVLFRELQAALHGIAVSKGADLGAVSKKQAELKKRTEIYAALMKEITGLELFVAPAAHMAEAEKQLNGGDAGKAAAAMQQAGISMKSESARVLVLMNNLVLVLTPLAPEQPVPPEILLCRDVMSVAAKQKSVYRESHAANGNQLKAFEPRLRELEKAVGPFIELAKLHKNPVIEEPVTPGEPVPAPKPVPPANLQLKLVKAKGYIANAANGAKAGDRAKTLAGEKAAADVLRHFVVEYALKFAVAPPPPAPGDPAPSEDFSEGEDLLMLYMPGAVSGKRPPDSKLEWEVLGKRDRAALNENFARELPLEYRAILKDYYERLAR